MGIQVSYHGLHFFCLPQFNWLSEVLEDSLPVAASWRGSEGGWWWGPLGRIWRGSRSWDGWQWGLGTAGWLHTVSGGSQPHSATPSLRQNHQSEALLVCIMFVHEMWNENTILDAKMGICFSPLHSAEGHTNERTAGYESSPSVSYRACAAPTRQERHISFICPAGDGAESEVCVSWHCTPTCWLHLIHESQSSLHSFCFLSGCWRSSSSKLSPQQLSVTPQMSPQLSHM